MVLDNGLKVMLISDPCAIKSAASLEVQTGSIHDTKGCSGIATLLQMSLMKSSKKFTKEKAYAEFLLKNGGDSNSYTSLYNTNYHFEIYSSAFYDGLDRFSSFFVSPKFNKKSTQPEMDAIN